MGTLYGVRNAERRMGRVAKAMIARGYSSDMALDWELDDGVVLRLTLGDAYG